MAMMAMLYTGTMDDILNLSPALRFLIEILVVLLLIHVGGYCIDNFHGLWGIGQIPRWIAVPLTVVASVGIINAINLDRRCERAFFGILHPGLHNVRHIVLPVGVYENDASGGGIGRGIDPFLFSQCLRENIADVHRRRRHTGDGNRHVGLRDRDSADRFSLRGFSGGERGADTFHACRTVHSRFRYAARHVDTYSERDIAVPPRQNALASHVYRIGRLAYGNNPGHSVTKYVGSPVLVVIGRVGRLDRRTVVCRRRNEHAGHIRVVSFHAMAPGSQYEIAA